MKVVITEWALQSYLNLLSANTFSRAEYWSTLRPDVERLRGPWPPVDPKFSNGKFWGPVTDRGGNTVQGAFKMKWHNLGPGKVQLRLGVVVFGGEALLLQAYSKTSDGKDKRECAKIKDRSDLVRAGRYQRRGEI